MKDKIVFPEGVHKETFFQSGEEGIPSHWCVFLLGR